jgi:predicted ATPase
MKIKAFSWSRYRAFKERQRVEVAPITIIIGKNGSGKSVVSRLSVLIAGAIEIGAGGPLNLTAGRLDHGASFQDLVNARSSLPFTLGVEIADGSESFEFEATLRYISESRSLVVEKFVLSDGTGQLLGAEITAEEQLIAAEPNYRLSVRDRQDVEQALTFNGLFPDITDDPATNAIFEKFRLALPAPSYLGPFRAEAEHFMRTPNQDIRDLGPRGENALEMLADDRLRRGGHLAKEVLQWFSRSMGQGVEVDVSSEQPKVRVVDASGFPVSLTDTGAGFPQSLPIVVQHLAYRSGRIRSPILIVEQPELHLHPAAHGALADLVVDTASVGAEWRPATCIVETHSEQFIMRVRRRIAEQEIAPEHVKIWSLNHVSAGAEDSPPEALRVISFDANGNPDSWPVGVFEEALDDLTAMRQSIRERKN